MDEPLITPTFASALARSLQDFLQDKRSRGCTHRREVYHLQQLDRFLISARLETVELPQQLVEKWLAQTVQRKPSTHRKRVAVIRQLAAYLRLQGYAAHMPLLPLTPHREMKSTARIFLVMRCEHCLRLPTGFPMTHTHLCGTWWFPSSSGYCMGVVCALARRVTVADVDLNAGTLSIHQGKFHRDRRVPLAAGLQNRLQRYANIMGVRAPNAPFFPAPQGRRYGNQGVYNIFRQLLDCAGIVHGGRGQGPRLHEIRRTFAVHRLEQWYRAGDDLNAKLPLLATFLGHQSMVGTQAYLQLTLTLFTDLANGLDAAYGTVIPGSAQ